MARLNRNQAKRNHREAIEEASKHLKNVGGEATSTLQNTSWSTLNGVQEYNELLLEIAQTNIHSALQCLRQMMTAKSPSDFIIVATQHARRHYEMSTEHAKELSALLQRMALNSTAPMRRQVGKMSQKAA